MSFPVLTPNSNKETFSINIPASVSPNTLHLAIAGELEEIARRIRSGELAVTDFKLKAVNGSGQMLKVEVY